MKLWHSQLQEPPRMGEHGRWPENEVCTAGGASRDAVPRPSIRDTALRTPVERPLILKGTACACSTHVQLATCP